MSTAIAEPIVTDAQKQQFQEEGFFILKNIVPADMLQMLREDCSYFIGYQDAQMDAANETTMGITHRSKRYFIGNRYRMSHRMWRFIYSDLMAQVAAAALGPDVYLFNEQWVVKGADVGMKFAWHQDSGYVKFGDPTTTHIPYLTCWITLDDVSEKNGTVYLLPHSRAGTKDTIFDHEKEEGTNDLIGYTGDDPGDPVIAPAGSIVAFSSYCFHRSGANHTPNMRRIYLAQYSALPIKSTKGGLWAMAVPFIKNGEVIYNHEDDTADKYGPGLREGGAS